MLEGLWEVLHLLTGCTAQAFHQYYDYTEQALDIVDPTMDTDIEMRDVSDSIAQATKDDGWKRPTSRSSSRKRSGGSKSDKPTKKKAMPPPVPKAVMTAASSASSSVDATSTNSTTTTTTTSGGISRSTDTASSGGADATNAIIRAPLKVKRRNDAVDESSLGYYIVSDLNDANNYPYQVPRHVVVCARDLPSAQGYIRNFLTQNGIAATNTTAADGSDLIMDDASTTWIEPAGDETWFIGNEMHIDEDVADGVSLHFFCAYGFDTPPMMQAMGKTASTVFILATSESHARSLADKTMRHMRAGSPSYDIATLGRVDGAVCMFPPNLSF